MINVFDSAKILCQSAMEIFSGLAKKNIAQRGSLAVALSGGSTPLRGIDLLQVRTIDDALLGIIRLGIYRGRFACHFCPRRTGGPPVCQIVSPPDRSSG